MTVPIKTPKKLIEVALPLDAINVAAAREKSIRHGHPSTLHLWWARRPLAAARAVLFAQMVNDPGYQQGGGFKYGMNKEKAAIERERLFKIIEDLVQWENTNNEEVLSRARAEIVRSWRETCELNKGHPQAAELFNPNKLPAFHDPFAGGGALPLEAQRLGLESYASDLNPVAVTINKAMIEIPPRFAGRAPVGPRLPSDRQGQLNEDWTGAKGLAEDVRRYGAWMRVAAQRRIGALYPPVEITPALAAARPDLQPLLGQKFTVIAWLWARTVKSPNPVFSHVDVPLASTFVLSSKAGKEAYVQPVVEGDAYRFTVKVAGNPDFDPAAYARAKSGTKLARGANFECPLSKTPINGRYIKAEGQAGRMGARLMAIVAEGPRGRIYLPPTEGHETIALQAQPTWKPETELPNDPRNFWTLNYGLSRFGDLFTPRQLVALTTFSDLVAEAIEKCRQDALAAGLPDDGVGLDQGGTGATAYAQAVGVYLAFAISKVANIGSSIASWMNDRGAFRETFARQAIPMVWDFAESNPFADAGGSLAAAIDKGAMSVRDLPKQGVGFALQFDAQTQSVSTNKVVSTDPPYYDNIGYADLSDFFYVWLRRSLRQIYPNQFATVAVPKAEELVATPYRHGGKEEAEKFFLDGMTMALHNLAQQAHPAFPVTIYYAFKQSETTGESGTSSTGWETFLEAVLKAGFALTGTWPVRTEGAGRMIASGTNALASSIVLVCRQRAPDAPVASRREFLRELNATLPEALEAMTHGEVHSPVAPVDLSQAIIGPGMAIFSQYATVLEADGTPMSVRTALQLINRFLAEDDFDHDTQFCLHWFEGQGWAEGKFGDADVLARAKGTSVGGLQAAGVVESGAGKLRLLRWAELPKDWSPETDTRTPVWEALHQMIRALNQDDETAAGVLLARMPARAEPIRALAYRLYTLCERKGWAEEARAYNELVAAWSGIEQASADTGIVGSQVQLGI
jgi:putative DNA methylase